MFHNHKTFLLFFISLFLTLNLIANGGPLDASRLYKTGNIRLIHHADIQLVSESIEVEVDGDYCFVQVEYELKNHAEGKTLEYGFPVDYFPPSHETPINKNNRYFRDGFKTDYIPCFEIKDSNTNLKHKEIQTDFTYISKFWGNSFKGLAGNLEKYDLKKYKSLTIPGREDTVHRRWYLSEIKFEKGETKKLIVNYQVKASFYDIFIGDDLYFSKRRFSYDLSPSKHWGDGKIESFSLKINFKNLETLELDHGLYGLEGVVKSRRGFECKANDFDLNKNDIFHLIYDNRCYKESQYLVSRATIPTLSPTSNKVENIDALFDLNANTKLKLKSTKKPLLKIKTKSQKFKLFGILRPENELITYKVSINFIPFGKKDANWESFIVKPRNRKTNLADIKANITCNMQELKRGHWDGEYFVLRGLKIEILDNPNGIESIHLPEMIVTKY